MVGKVSDMLKDIPIPKMVRIRQNFDASQIEDIAATVREELSRDALISAVKPGMSIAITAGSRGVNNIALIIREIAEILREKGAIPFIIPAMGSHGGSLAENQRAIVEGYGITAEYTGCDIKASMETVQIGVREDNGRPIFIDKFAAEADGIVVVGRVKPHTSFRWKYESGVMKMMTIGLGKQRGAEACHYEGMDTMGYNVEMFARGILKNANILFGVGIVENAYDKTAIIKAMTPQEIPELEPGLLETAREKMARIMFDKLDVLLVDEIGKNISGEGADPNVTGRFSAPCCQGDIEVKRFAVLDITEESHGNGMGLGMADLCSQRVFNKFDREMSYPNALTSRYSSLCAMPMVFENHKVTIQAAIQMLLATEPQDATVVRIKNTLKLGEIEISENLLELARQNPNIEILGEPHELVFDENGDLF